MDGNKRNTKQIGSERIKLTLAVFLTILTKSVKFPATKFLEIFGAMTEFIAIKTKLIKIQFKEVSF